MKQQLNDFKMMSPLTKVIYYFTDLNTAKIKGLLKDAEVLPEMDFYKFTDLIFKIYGTC